ncbi:MAG: ABC-2 family transporter protein [Bdellovibrio sp.]
MKNLSKWLETIRISMSKVMAYRLNFLLQIIGPTLVFYFIKYNLWSSIFKDDPMKEIGGYTLATMLAYHTWGLLVELLASGYTAMNLSEDIRLGRISTYLIYPFNFWEFHTASFIGFQITQLFIALVTFIAVALSGLIDVPSVMLVIKGLGFTLAISFMWFAMNYGIGLMAFWLEETWILKVILMVIASFLSGGIIPLELFPKWLSAILEWTPFPYMSYYPVKIFMGYEPNYMQAFVTCGSWFAFFLIFNAFIWKRGMKLYTAAGM